MDLPDEIPLPDGEIIAFITEILECESQMRLIVLYRRILINLRIPERLWGCSSHSTCTHSGVDDLEGLIAFPFIRKADVVHLLKLISDFPGLGQLNGQFRVKLFESESRHVLESLIIRFSWLRAFTERKYCDSEEHNPQELRHCGCCHHTWKSGSCRTARVVFEFWCVKSNWPSIAYVV